MSKTNDYVPGKGYRDGWKDRHNGKSEATPNSYSADRRERQHYWDEYERGYSDADRKIHSDARISVGLPRFTDNT